MLISSIEAEQFAESLEAGLDWEERDWSQRLER